VIGGSVRRRTLLVVLAALAVVVAVAVVVLWPQQDRIKRENYERIQRGMSLAEVEAILGPPGDCRTRPTIYVPHIFAPPRLADRLASEPDVDIKKWEGDSGDIEVVFRDGETKAAFYATDPLNQGPIANLLWRLKRQWHRWFPE
jgi:hypothetical protein